MRQIRFTLAALFTSALLAACGGGDDAPPVVAASPTLTGLAATGAAMANATLTAKCVTGAPVTGTANAGGVFTLTLNGGQTAPCMVQATSGSVTLHSFAADLGRINITPLTELVVTKALGTSAAAGFATFDAAKGAAIKAALAPAKAYVTTLITAQAGAAPSGDVLTGVFQVGDADDKLLDKLAAALLAAGKSLDTLRAGAEVTITTVKVAGDSIADSGTFGIKFSMQGNATDPMKIWTERIAESYKLAPICARYGATGPNTVVLNPAATACTSYAVGGGRINMASAPTSPFSIPQQLKDMATEKPYAKGDLLLVDGGGNDAADLTGAFLNVPADGGLAYRTLLVSLLPATTVDPLLAQGQAGAAQAGGAYMMALANKMYDAVKTQALDKGAKNVVVLNMPGITNTPRFQGVLALVAAANGGGTAGATARAQTEALIKQWATAFNAQLKANFANNSSVVLVDFYGRFNDQIARPAAYGLTNVTVPACPTTGTGTDGLPTYDAASCTATSLSAQTPPAGATGGTSWWKTYLFSDGFHPTIYGYQLMGDLVKLDLTLSGR